MNATMDSPAIANCIPCLEGREKELVAQQIADGWLAVGPCIQRFENAIGAFTGAPHAVAVINGTAALQLALVCAGVAPGDLVLLPSLTFAASANAVRHCGATPMFFDAEPVSWGIDVDQIARYLQRDCATQAGRLVDRASGARIGAMMPVHLYGHPIDLDPLVELAERYGIPVVEDGAEALGALYKDRRVGSLHRICCLSFNGNKIITSGNGGMILTSDADFARRGRYLASQARDDANEFVHGEIGYNYRLTNLNAALGLAQSEKLPEFLGRKRRIVERYAARLGSVPGVGLWREAAWARSSYWMAILTVDERRHPGAIAGLRRFLPTRGIEARPVWQPLHRQKPFAGTPHQPIEVAERLYRTGLCLPCSAGLSDVDLDRVADTIEAFFAQQPR